MLEVVREKALDEVAVWLQLAIGAEVLVRRRRYLADGEPMELATSYVPWELAEGTTMTQADTGPGGIYARLEEAGHRLKRFSEEVSARMPTVDEVGALRLEPGVPVIRLVRIAYDERRAARRGVRHGDGRGSLRPQLRAACRLTRAGATQRVDMASGHRYSSTRLYE